MPKRFKTAGTGIWAALLLGACAHVPTESGSHPDLADLDSYALMRTDGGVRTATPVSVAEAADVLKDYDVIVLAELHDHPGNHIAQMALYRALQARAGAVDLSMEQFERDVQPVIDDYLGGKIGEQALKKQGRAWDNYDSDYRPLVEYAKAHHLAVIAADPPTNIVRCVGQEGPEILAKMSPANRALVAADVHVTAGSYRDKFLGFATENPGHGGGTKEAPSAAALRGYAAQVARDDTMAESIVRFLAEHPGHKIVHLTGNFHAEDFLGTVERIKLRDPRLKIAVVNPVMVDDPAKPSIDADDAKSGTFVLMLRPLPKSYASDEEMKAAVSSQMARRPDAKCDL